MVLPTSASMFELVLRISELEAQLVAIDEAIIAGGDVAIKQALYRNVKPLLATIHEAVHVSTHSTPRSSTCNECKQSNDKHTAECNSARWLRLIGGDVELQAQRRAGHD